MSTEETVTISLKRYEGMEKNEYYKNSFLNSLEKIKMLTREVHTLKKKLIRERKKHSETEAELILSQIEKVSKSVEICRIADELARSTAASEEHAIMYLKHSNNFQRDSFIIEKLSNVGYPSKRILQIIKIINE